ncbi:MAG: cell wall-binding repeat-containing protein [Acidimicrobiia bacterium]|nr:MAG: cell wall-binding repeat-containing protein [Acidimicrobiia bacterium]
MRRGVVIVLVLLGASLLPSAVDADEPQGRRHERLAGELQDLVVGRPAGIANEGFSADRIPVTVLPSGSAKETAAAVEAVGGMVLAVTGGSVIAQVPVGSLLALADHAAVGFIAASATPHTEGNVSEGVSLHGAAGWFPEGMDGSGIQVMVVDQGFVGYSTAVANDDLPVAKGTRVGPTCGGGSIETATNHGTAVAEIVHDMAPGAEMFLYRTCSSGDGSDLVAYAASNGIDVVNQSLGFFNTGPLDGSDPVGYLWHIDQIVDSGVVWVNSAGNYRQQHWLGTWTTGTDGRLDLDPGPTLNQEITVSPAPAGQTVYLRWDDWPTTDIDLDLFLLDGGVELDSSTQDQNGSQPPLEEVTTPYGGTFTIEVRLGDDESAASIPPTMKIDIFAPGTDIEAALQVQESSLNDAAALSRVLAAGAAYRGTAIQEVFSSEGPTWDGRTKPDLAGYDGVSTMQYPFGFYGTSAAAPHAAGSAVLVRSAFPCLSESETRALLATLVADAGVPGPDNEYGTGIVTLGDPGSVASSCVMRRHAGADRFDTAARVSRAVFPGGASTVIVATGRDFPDALSGAAAAARFGAPILLVDTDSIPGSTASELSRLSPDDILILGGTAAVSGSVETALAAYSTNPPQRIGGSNRYHTAALISQAAYPDPGPVTTVFVATGTGFADALAGGPAAAHLDAPLLLTRPDSLPSETIAELNRLQPETIVILGGTAAVSTSVETALAAYATEPPVRRGGSNRYDTARLIGEYAFPDGFTPLHVYVATGTNYPDALAGAAAAANQGASLVITDPAALSGPTRTEIVRIAPEALTILGGSGAVEVAVQVEMQTLMH